MSLVYAATRAERDAGRLGHELGPWHFLGRVQYAECLRCGAQAEVWRSTEETSGDAVLLPCREAGKGRAA